MKKCKVTYRERDKKGKYKGKEITVDGLFHTWGVDNGVEAFGLVELSDGRMIGAHPTCIKFEVPDIKELVPSASLKEKRELGCRVFTGGRDKVDGLVNDFLNKPKIDVSRIFKILQSECVRHEMLNDGGMAIGKGEKSITITIFYYKE